MAKKNIELLKRLRTRFLRMRHPKHFNMGDVAQKTDCGTAMCIAGHALDLEGYRFNLDEDGDFLECFAPNGRRVHNELVRAQRLLGLTKDEAQRCGSTDTDNGLFLRFDLKTPKQAAKVIERLIADA